MSSIVHSGTGVLAPNPAFNSPYHPEWWPYLILGYLRQGKTIRVESLRYPFYQDPKPGEEVDYIVRGNDPSSS